MKKKAFVTGATGFVGINLVRELLKEEWKVVAFHRPSPNLKYLRELDVKLVEGDLLDFESIYSSLPGDSHMA